MEIFGAICTVQASHLAFGLRWKGHVCASMFFFFLFVGPMHCSRDSQLLFSTKTTFKLGYTVLFTHLKCILLQCFQFSVINGIQTNTKCDCVRQVAFINPKVTVDSSESFSKLPQTISHLLEFFLGSSEGDLSLLDWHGS